MQINALEDEIFYSSLIEGERLKRLNIRSSVKKRLDENFDWLADTHATRHSDNLASLMLDANLNKAPMNFERHMAGTMPCLNIAIAKFTR